MRSAHIPVRRVSSFKSSLQAPRRRRSWRASWGRRSGRSYARSSRRCAPPRTPPPPARDPLEGVPAPVPAHDFETAPVPAYTSHCILPFSTHPKRGLRSCCLPRVASEPREREPLQAHVLSARPRPAPSPVAPSLSCRYSCAPEHALRSFECFPAAEGNQNFPAAEVVDVQSCLAARPVQHAPTSFQAPLALC